MPFRFLLLALLLPMAVAAQPVRPFETLEVGLSGAATLGEAPYTDLWDPGLGVEGRVETPFYLGRFTVGAAVAPHTAPDDVAPDYLALYFFGVWSADIALPAGLRLSPGLQAGLFRMQFDTDDDAAVRNEAELAVGPEVWLSAPLAGPWRLRAGVGGVRIFTNQRIDLRFVRVGVSRTFRTPGWLEDVLR
jgi:hypothetical protein